MMLILRRENGELCRYAHRHRQLPRGQRAAVHRLQPADLGRRALRDVSKLFSQLIGMGKTMRMKKLLHAPFTLKKTLLDLITRDSSMRPRPAGAHHPEDQRTDRSEDDQGAVQGQPDRRACGPHRARHVLPAPWHRQSRTTFMCARSSVASSSTAGCSTSRTMATRNSISSADWMERNPIGGGNPLPGRGQEAGDAGEERAGGLPQRQHPELDPAA